MDSGKGNQLDKEHSCNSAFTGVNEAGCDGNPRLRLAAWSDIRLIRRHGAYCIYTAIRYGRKYLLKGLSENHRALPEWQRLLFKEFELGFQIDHPNIARTVGWEAITGVGESVVMEFVDGQELGQWLKTCKTQTPDRRLDVVKQIAEALVYIHSMGISHRDLKPDNILITRKGCQVKIIDFGHGDSEDFIVYKRAAGTKSFGAPEQASGKMDAAMSADIYSLGKIMEILLPNPRYRRIIKRCLREDPSARPSATDLLESLNGKTYFIPVAIGALLVALLGAGLISNNYNNEVADDYEAPDTPVLNAPVDTVYVQKTDTVFVQTPSQPSKAQIKAVWDKVMTDVEPMTKFYATFDFIDKKDHKDEYDKLIPHFGDNLYLGLLEIGCTEGTATAKRKELMNYMRRRYNEYKASKPTAPSDSLP